jgi:hypothetical protein
MDLPLLKWLYTKVQRSTFIEALERRDANDSLVGKRFIGSVAILTWLHTHSCLDLASGPDQKLIADAAIVDSHLHTLKWLCSKGYELELDNNTMNDLQHVVEPANLLSTFAARNGHLSMVNFLHEQGVSFQQARRAAAQSGSVPLMRYLIEQNIEEWDASGLSSLQSLLFSAGVRGHISMMAFLRQQGALWPQQLWKRNVMTDIGKSCWPLAALLWALANGCPLGEWPVGLCDELVACEYAEEVEWLHAHGAPCGADCPAR